MSHRAETGAAAAQDRAATGAVGGQDQPGDGGRHRARRGTLLRSVLVAAALLGWLVIAGFGGIAQGTLSQVQENDDAAFLPASAESTRAADLAREFSDSESIPALVVVERIDQAELSEQDFAALTEVAEQVAELDLAGQAPLADYLIVDPAVVPAEDGAAAMIVLSLDADASDELLADEERVLTAVITAVRAHLGDALGSDLQAWVTGPAGSVADLLAAFAGIDGLLLAVALGVVLLILIVVYRSPVLPFLVMFTSVSALCLAALVVKPLAGAGALVLSGQTQGILSILVIGAATDYGLLMVARYREELGHQADPAAAMRTAWRACLAPITASAGTVIVGLLCLMLSDLSSNASLGPVAAIGIAASVVGALTLLPALLVIAGRRSRVLFWPRQPRYSPDASATGTSAAAADVAASGRHGLWPRVATFVSAHARSVWIVTAVVLLAMASMVTTLRAEGTSGTDVFLADTESVTGEAVLAEHFDAGTVQPIQVITAATSSTETLEALSEMDGVTQALPVSEASEDGGPPDDSDAEPMVVRDRVLVEVSTTESAESQQALETVAQVRDLVRDIDPDALVGGAAAERLDTQDTARSDLGTIIPLVLVAIFAMLVLLLRAVVAPLLILAANLLSFGATMGLAAVLFNHVFGFPGADATVPLYGFVFLVALSIDYSIFLMTRVREESLSHGTRSGVGRGLLRTGPVITSAGLVLAATFSALAVIPLLFLVQLAVIVALGVLIDTFVVRSLLVPGLVHDVGRASWWPWQRRIPVDT